MRHSSPQVDTLYNVVLDPRRLIRWIYIGRLSIASSIFVAAVVTWFNTERPHESVDDFTPVDAEHLHYRYRASLDQAG